RVPHWSRVTAGLSGVFARSALIRARRCFWSIRCASLHGSQTGSPARLCRLYAPMVPHGASSTWRGSRFGRARFFFGFGAGIGFGFGAITLPLTIFAPTCFIQSLQIRHDSPLVRWLVTPLSLAQ